MSSQHQRPLPIEVVDKIKKDFLHFVNRLQNKYVTEIIYNITFLV